ncbi:MAG: DUF5719 family protein [Nocardioides sp.]|uniref:DUF5719 family protein n=1 Tax=Nocardioides sp. TaxID=35761 RepID=UPI0039E518CC
MSHADHRPTRPARRERRVRRQRSGRFEMTMVVAVVLVIVVAGALALDRSGSWSQPTAGPATAALSRAAVVCPPTGESSGSDETATGAGTVLAASLGGASGDLSVSGDGATGADQSVSVDADTPAEVEAGSGSVVLSARGDLAAGLVAGRSTRGPLAATDCGAPTAEEWFTGLGAGAVHDSTLDLTNPNSGAAVVDVTVLTRSGEVDVSSLRGIAVPGGSTRSFDLLSLLHRRGMIALHTVVTRGEVVASVRDRSTHLTGKGGSSEWLAGQEQPARSNLLLGLPDNASSSTLTIANPGENQVTATLKLVTPSAVLTPADAPEISIAPSSVVSVDLGDVLSGDAAEDAYGIEVTGSGAVTAALRTVRAGDLALTTPSAQVSARTAVLTPVGVGTKQVLLAGATGVGVVTVVSRAADGSELDSTKVAIKQQQGAVVDVPRAAAMVEIEPRRTRVAASVLLAGRGRRGAAVVPFRELVTAAEVPSVQPGLVTAGG